MRRCLSRKRPRAVNMALGVLDRKKGEAIIRAADDVLAGKHDDDFPLVAWQTGSGTQTNMNVNEVLANRASELLGGERGDSRLVHPNDDVNKGQSSNDMFPTAMHVAAVVVLERDVKPAVDGAARHARCESRGVRRHRQDRPHASAGRHAAHAGAGVLRLRRAARSRARAHRAALAASVASSRSAARRSAPVSTRIRNSRRKVAAEIATLTRLPFVTAPNKFEALAGTTRSCMRMARSRRSRASLMKIANDVRWLASGRAPASASSPFRKTSPAARSCRAR